MLHSQIENEEIVDRYVRNQLAPAERQAFEEHFLGCDDCFEKLQTAERFAAGMRDAAARGLLEISAQAPAMARASWLSWAFAATACVALIFAGWAYFVQIPRLRSELRQATKSSETGQQEQAAASQASPTELAEANVPLVMLQATRSSGEAASVVLKTGDRRLVLWIEPGPSRYREFRLEVYSPNDELATSVDHLKQGPYGGLAVSLAAEQLPSGEFRITLSGQDPSPASLVGEYRLRVRRP
jgi:hypothetical protein